MYRTIKEFTEDWARESGTSLKVERALTDASLSQKTDPEGRTLGQLAWHLAGMIGPVASALGLEVETPVRGSDPPDRAATIAAAYQKAAQSLSDQVTKKLRDDQLGSEVPLFGRNLPIRTALHALIRHQIHHRGQMTALMRAAGVAVPSIYGPSREESAAMRAKGGR